MCDLKNVVYEITCRMCGDTYIGETSVTIRRRLKQHMRDENSQVRIHLAERHAIDRVEFERMTEKIEWSILGRGFADTTQRKTAEEHHIQQKKPKLNIMLNTMGI